MNWKCTMPQHPRWLASRVQPLSMPCATALRYPIRQLPSSRRLDPEASQTESNKATKFWWPCCFLLEPTKRHISHGLNKLCCSRHERSCPVCNPSSMPMAAQRILHSSVAWQAWPGLPKISLNPECAVSTVMRSLFSSK